MIDRETLEEYGRRFSAENITVKRMICLSLFVSDDCEAHEEINELIDDMEADECLSLFAFPETFSHIEDDNREEWAEIIIEYRKGWLIFAYVSDPACRGMSYHVLVYAETLEDALEKVIVRADEILERAFNKEREE